MHSLVQTLLVTGSVQSLFLCGKCRCGTEQSAAENGRKSGRDREREHRKGNYFYRCRRDPSADGSPVFGSRRVRERLSFRRSYGKRVVPWNFFCRRNRNPGTGCTCRPGQPGVHSLGKLPADKGVTAAGGGTGFQGGGRCQRVIRRRA